MHDSETTVIYLQIKKITFDIDPAAKWRGRKHSSHSEMSHYSSVRPALKDSSQQSQSITLISNPPAVPQTAEMNESVFGKVLTADKPLQTRRMTCRQLKNFALCLMRSRKMRTHRTDFLLLIGCGREIDYQLCQKCCSSHPLNYSVVKEKHSFLGGRWSGQSLFTNSSYE